MTSATADQQPAPNTRRTNVPAAHGAVLRQALQPLNGLRVIAAIQIMVFHHMLLRHFSPDESDAALRARPVAINAILVGNLGLDDLFLISAFLATLTLVPALEQARGSTWQEVLRYWYRRAVRIAPAHWVSLVVTYVFMLRGRHASMPPETAAPLAQYPEEACPGGLWTQAVFLGHWRVSTKCGMQLWSQGLQAAFWLWLPLLLAAARPQRESFRRRAATLAGLVIALSTAYRAWADWRHLSWPLAIFAPPDHEDTVAFTDYLDVHHSPLPMRAASLAVGCLAALPFLDPRSFQHPAGQQHHSNGSAHATLAMDGGRRKQEAVAISVMSPKTARIGTQVAAAVIAVMYAAASCRPTGAPTWPRAVAVPALVTILQGGVLSSAVTVFIMVVMMTRAGATGRLLHAALAAPFWKPLAELSYSAYLYHIQARYWVWRYGLLPSGLYNSAADLGAFVLEMAVCVPATFAVAYLSYWLVEQPASRLGRRMELRLLGGLAASAKTSVTGSKPAGKAATAS